MKFNAIYNIGDFVYLITDPDQHRRMIIEISVYVGEVIMYKLALGAEHSWHHEMELSDEKDNLIGIIDN